MNPNLPFWVKIFIPPKGGGNFFFNFFKNTQISQKSNPQFLWPPGWGIQNILGGNFFAFHFLKTPKYHKNRNWGYNFFYPPGLNLTFKWIISGCWKMRAVLMRSYILLKHPVWKIIFLFIWIFKVFFSRIDHWNIRGVLSVLSLAVVL